ncbi:MAG: alpha-L-arabinofuranosidase, partial [Sphingobacteriaceae bacterium]
AAQSDHTVSVNNKNTWQTAMSEAAFMTGLERNADVVSMASYAPLFAHADGWQWTPDLIWVDNLRSYGTADYQVQKLFSLNKGTQEIPILMDEKAVSGKDGFYACAALDKATNELILKVVNTSAKAQMADFMIDGAKIKSKANVSTLASDNLEQVNSFDNPSAVSPKTQEVSLQNKKLQLQLKPYSFSVIRIKKA